MSNMKINSNTYAQPMSEEAKKFFASPSKLSKSKRFKGSVHSATIQTRHTEQSNGMGGTQ